MNSLGIGDKVREVSEAVDTVLGPSAGLVPPIRLVWDALAAAWKPATASATAGNRESQDALMERLGLLVMWPFLVLLWLIVLPLALPSSIPTPARTALLIVCYGLMAWLVPTWVFPALVEQLNGWWRWALAAFMFSPTVAWVRATFL